jgi:hypothetical protein
VGVALLVGCGGDDAVTRDAGAGPDGRLVDAPVDDSSVDAKAAVDASKIVDAMKPVDAAGIDAAPAPGTTQAAAGKTCRTILSANRKSPSGMYWINPNEGSTDDAFMTFCDMVTNAKGWTRVNGLDPAVVDLIRGTDGRQMLKCTSEDNTRYIVSPVFKDAWSWTRSAPVKLAGAMASADPWFVNDELADCGADAEFNSICSGSWWGVGCSSGAGAKNKLYPGVLSSQTCSGAFAAHTNGVFSICGDNDYKNYVVFVRSDK